MLKNTALDSRPSTSPIQSSSNKNPGTLRWLISADESGTDSNKYYGFGALWMKYQRRGDFLQGIWELRVEHDYWEEIKWTNIFLKRLEFYEDLIEYFFKHDWLAFRCLIVPREIVDMAYHLDNPNIGFFKHYGMFIEDGIKKCTDAHPDRDMEFRVWVDNLSSSYKKEAEKMEKILISKLKKELSVKYNLTSVIQQDSKKAQSIQLADLLLGAVMAAWRQETKMSAKLDLQLNIAEHLDWRDLRADTWKTERKFNIWWFHPNRERPRYVKTRDVNLKYKYSLFY